MLMCGWSQFLLGFLNPTIFLPRFFETFPSVPIKVGIPFRPNRSRDYLPSQSKSVLPSVPVGIPFRPNRSRDYLPSQSKSVLPSVPIKVGFPFCPNQSRYSLPSQSKSVFPYVPIKVGITFCPNQSRYSLPSQSKSVIPSFLFSTSFLCSLAKANYLLIVGFISFLLCGSPER